MALAVDSPKAIPVHPITIANEVIALTIMGLPFLPLVRGLYCPGQRAATPSKALQPHFSGSGPGFHMILRPVRAHVYAGADSTTPFLP